jgi:hypothetical protein
MSSPAAISVSDGFEPRKAVQTRRYSYQGRRAVAVSGQSRAFSGMKSINVEYSNLVGTPFSGVKYHSLMRAV